MTIKVLLFAVLRDAAGIPEARVELPAGATARSAADQLVARFPSLGPYMGRIAFAVNQQYVPPQTPIHDGDELALIPPVSGG